MLIAFCSAENGHNPIWNETCEFLVKNPNFAMLRFEVQDEDMFGEPNFIGQAVYPVSRLIFFFFLYLLSFLVFIYPFVFQLNCLRTGLRSVPLKNKFSEEFELAALLVQLQIQYADKN